MLRNRIFVTAPAVALLACAVSTVEATQLTIGGNIGSSMLFDKSDGANGEIDIAGAFLGGVSFFDPTFVNILDIADGGTFSWSGNPLNSDDSAGGLADGSFGGGGVLSMNGTVKSGFAGIPVFTGLALEGTVSAFELDENVGAGNFLDSLFATFTPTGGWLFDNGHVVNPYSFSLSIIGAQQDNGDVEDYQTDIQFTTSSTFQMTEIPEPSTLILMSGFGLALLGRKRARN